MRCVQEAGDGFVVQPFNRIDDSFDEQTTFRLRYTANVFKDNKLGLKGLNKFAEFLEKPIVCILSSSSALVRCGKALAWRAAKKN